MKEFAGNLQLNYENNTRHRITHALATDGPNELQQCILLGASYVQRVVHALNDHFPNLPIFNASKILNPHKYPRDDSDRVTNTKLGPKRILLKFQYIDKESDMCKEELLELMKILQHE